MRRSGETGPAASQGLGLEAQASAPSATPAAGPSASPLSDRPTLARPGSARPGSARPAAEQAVGHDAFRRYESALSRLRPRDQRAVRARIELRQPYAALAESLGLANAQAARAVVTRALGRLVEEMSS